MKKAIFSFLTRWQKKNLIKEILENRKLMEEYKEEKARELAFLPLYLTSQKIQQRISKVTSQKVGEVVLNVHKVIQKHQRALIEEIEEVFELNEIIQQSPLIMLQDLEESQTEQEKKLRIEVENYLKEALP